MWGATLLIANEFFDALPVRQFEKTSRGWAERMVGVDADGQTLRFALAPGVTPYAVLLAGVGVDGIARVGNIEPDRDDDCDGHRLRHYQRNSCILRRNPVGPRPRRPRARNGIRRGKLFLVRSSGLDLRTNFYGYRALCRPH